jgi:hypothetical protein
VGPLVPIFGMYFAMLTFVFSIRNTFHFIIKPLTIGSIAMALFAIFEIFSWWSDEIRSSFLIISSVIHQLVRRGESIEGRVQSFTFEASNFGFYVVLVVPLLLAVGYSSIRRRTQIVSIFMAGLLSIESLLSGRTSVIGILVVYFAFYGVRGAVGCRGAYGMLVRRAVVAMTLSAGIIPMLLIVGFGDNIGAYLLDADNVSNLSRFMSIYVQAHLFAENPIFGVGFNQYGFYVPGLMPSWAFNWETQKWMTDPNASFFPSFSLYARIAGELGILGLLYWIGTRTAMLLLVLEKAANLRRQGERAYLGIAICTLFIGELFVGWTIASMKVVNFWMPLGLGFAYLYAASDMEMSISERSAKRARTDRA